MHPGLRTECRPLCESCATTGTLCTSRYPLKSRNCLAVVEMHLQSRQCGELFDQEMLLPSLSRMLLELQKNPPKGHKNQVRRKAELAKLHRHVWHLQADKLLDRIQLIVPQYEKKQYRRVHSTEMYRNVKDRERSRFLRNLKISTFTPSARIRQKLVWAREP